MWVMASMRVKRPGMTKTKNRKETINYKKLNIQNLIDETQPKNHHCTLIWKKMIFILYHQRFLLLGYRNCQMIANVKCLQSHWFFSRTGKGHEHQVMLGHEKQKSHLRTRAPPVVPISKTPCRTCQPINDKWNQVNYGHIFVHFQFIQVV